MEFFFIGSKYIMDSQQRFDDVLTESQIQYINGLTEVDTARHRIENGAKVSYFSIQLTSSIKATLQERLGLDLSEVNQIPLRWIRGDTDPHIDVGSSTFDNTYLLYLNDSPGVFILDGVSHPILANTSYVFNEGLSHETINTGTVPRLLLGPMNEFAQPVGASTTFYYPSETDALANTNIIIAYGNYEIFSVSGYNHWRIASTSTGPSPQNVVYNVGDVLSGTYPDVYYLYPANPCFLEGTTILCKMDGVEKYIPVEELKNGTLVKTSRNGFKPLVAIGKASIQNPGTDERIEDRLYKCSPSKYPDLKEDLYITGCHSILEFPITEKQKEDIIKHLGKLFVTDNKYRLIACVDERAEPWNSEGTYTIYHFALEHHDDKMNYGVYANGGLLVETCSINFLKNKSNLRIL
jgi:hypothetical protein